MWRRAAALASGVAAGALATDETTRRAARATAYAAIAAADYKLRSNTPEQLKAAHERNAARLLHVCNTHGGLYTKLGQFVSTLNQLPAEYRTTLAACQDAAPSVPFEQARLVVEEELGRPLEAHFVRFEREPVAAASLAQVHRATLRDGGGSVAVKVQYPQLSHQVTSDLRTLRVLSRLLGAAFSAYDYSWLVPDFSRDVAAELDFRREADNARRVAAHFATWPQVHVPRVVESLSTARVLTMEWIDGVRLDDRAGLASRQLRRGDFATLLSSTFAAMIFEHGFLHCDPHPGNLLARRCPESGLFQLVLLDHGLCRELPPAFRANYARLWCALLGGDAAAGRAAARGLGVRDEDYEALSLLLVFRSADSRAPAGTQMSATEREAVRERFKNTRAVDVNEFLQRLPREMLLVFRTWALVRALNRELGGSARNRFRIIADAAARCAFTLLPDEGGVAAAATGGYRSAAGKTEDQRGLLSHWLGIAWRRLWQRVALARFRLRQRTLEVAVWAIALARPLQQVNMG